MSAHQDNREKAAADLRVRSEKSLGVDARSTAFVIVTLRRFVGREAWLARGHAQIPGGTSSSLMATISSTG
jgi:hypothetical protein